MSEAQVITASIPGEADPDPPSDLNAPEPEQQAELVVPDKFKNEDGTPNIAAILKAHGELEGKLGSPKPTEEPATETEAEPSLELPEPKPGEGFLADMAKWSEEYAKGEGLSDATYAQIKKDYGVDRAGADRVIAGEQAIADAGVRKIVDSAGGQEAYTKMLQWMAKNDGRESVNEFTSGLMDAMLAGDQARVDRELGGAKARYKEGTRTGWAPEITGRDANGNSIQPFANQGEVDKIQASMEYEQGDAAYHAVFNQRLKLAMDLGIVQ